MTGASGLPVALQGTTLCAPRRRGGVRHPSPWLLRFVKQAIIQVHATAYSKSSRVEDGSDRPQVRRPSDNSKSEVRPNGDTPRRARAPTDGPALPSPQLSPAVRRPLCDLMTASPLRQYIRYSALRARVNESGGCHAAPHCLVTSCFLYCLPEAARRFGTCSRKCAAGAAAQAPLGLNARPATLCSARSLGWPGSGLTMPFGAWFSHPPHSSVEGCCVLQILRDETSGVHRAPEADVEILVPGLEALSRRAPQAVFDVIPAASPGRPWPSRRSPPGAGASPSVFPKRIL